MPALKQDLFRMLALKSCRSTFLEPFPVLLPQPESFQLFPQCSSTGTSSGPWVGIPSGPWHCCTSSPVCWDTSRAPRAVPMLLSGLCVHKSRLKGLGTGRKTQVGGGFVAPLGDFLPDKIISLSVFLEEAGERCGKSLQERGYL